MMHQMTVTEARSDGRLWECSSCDYRFIMQGDDWSGRVILSRGDEHVLHSGSSIPGLQITGLTVEQ